MSIWPSLRRAELIYSVTFKMVFRGIIVYPRPSKECVRACVWHTHNLDLIQELLGFFLVANDETRKNVTGLIKEAINTSVKITDNKLVIGILGKTAVISHIY